MEPAPITQITRWLESCGRHLLMLVGGDSEGVIAALHVLLAGLLAASLGATLLLLWQVVRRSWRLDDPPQVGSPWSQLRLLNPSVTGILILPGAMVTMTVLLMAWPTVAVWAIPAVAWLGLMVALIVVARIAYLAIDPLLAPLQERARASMSVWDDLLLELAGRLARGIVVFACMYAQLRLVAREAAWQGAVDTLFALMVIVAITWVLIALVQMGEGYVRGHYRMDVADNLSARRVLTQLMVLRRLIYLFIVVVALALALMQFDGIRRVGTSILASAGLAGIIVGFAAQKTLANLLAGVQIALTQPLRIDDVLIIDGEYGKVEEITLTYVVLAIWDQRRLIVPLSRIIETPFQNWTREGSELLGTVTLRCDFSVPVVALRAQAQQQAEADPRWDRRVCVVQVTAWDEQTVEIRILLSARDAGALFDLRCAVREALLEWLQKIHPGAMPQHRLATVPIVPASELLRISSSGQLAHPA